MKRIVIVGAGFGGLRTAFLISRKLQRLGLSLSYEVVLIDRNAYHTYTPLLYEIATTSKDAANLAKLHTLATHPLKTLIGTRPITFIQDEVSSIDVAEREVHMRDGSAIRPDILVIAAGSETNYFNIKGLREHSLPLKTFIDAARIRDTLWNRAMSKARVIRVILGGGGPSGVELAGELKMLCAQLEREFPQCRLDIRIIEARPTLLFGFPKNVYRKAMKRLRRLGVEPLENEKVVSLVKDHVNLESGRSIPYDVFVWTGGITPPGFLAAMPLKKDPSGRIEVDGHMECLPPSDGPGSSLRIYCIGDAASYSDPTTRAHTQCVAPAAIDEATVAAHNIIEDLRKDSGAIKPGRRTTLIIKNYPYIIPVGGKFAIASIGPLAVSGLAGWIVKGVVELRYLFSIMPPVRAVRAWFRGFLVFIKNDRLG